MNQAVIRQLRNLTHTGRLSSHQEKILCLNVAKYLSYKIQLVSQGTTCDRRVGEIARIGELCRYRYHLRYHSDRHIIVILTAEGGCGACDKSESRVMLVSEDISSRSGARLWRPDLCQWVTL